MFRPVVLRGAASRNHFYYNSVELGSEGQLAEVQHNGDGQDNLFHDGFCAGNYVSGDAKGIDVYPLSKSGAEALMAGSGNELAACAVALGAQAFSPPPCATACDSGFFSDACLPCPDCGSNGRCLDGIDGSGKCDCDSGFSGAHCELAGEPLLIVNKWSCLSSDYLSWDADTETCTLLQDLPPFSGSGVSIRSVTLDCAGFAIRRLLPAEGGAIGASGSGSWTIRNCVIENFKTGVSPSSQSECHPTKILDNTISGAVYGVWLTVDNVVIARNNITASSVGFYLKSGAQYNRIYHNNILGTQQMVDAVHNGNDGACACGWVAGSTGLGLGVAGLLLREASLTPIV